MAMRMHISRQFEGRNRGWVAAATVAMLVGLVAPASAALVEDAGPTPIDPRSIIFQTGGEIPSINFPRYSGGELIEPPLIGSPSPNLTPEPASIALWSLAGISLSLLSRRWRRG